MKALVLSTTLLLIGCAGAGAQSVPKISEAERTRASLQNKDAQTLAPQAYAEAEQALAAAKAADKAGDLTAAELHAEHAVAAYQHAIALARLARATQEETTAKDALTKALEQSERFGAARKAAEREADDLEKQIKIQREAEKPAASAPTDPEREKARLVAAQSLAVQARLLCSAARLVSAQAAGLTEAETATNELEKKLEGSPKPAPIDAAARARAACLNVLTKARRTGTPDSDQADLLLGELSKAADPKSKTDLSPTRDERGVVVTLRSIFKGDALTPEGETALKELGKVAAAHPAFGVQVVMHDATQPSANEASANKKRADATAKALTDGGAASAKTKVELAGARAPIIDPSDVRRRDRNARVEVVFVN